MEPGFMLASAQHWRVSHTKCVQYDIICCPGLFERIDDCLLNIDGEARKLRRFVVIDEHVYQAFAYKIHHYFQKQNVITKIVPLKTGESNKSMEQYISLLKALDTFPLHRRNKPIIGIGGGVLTDLVGFVASTYRRGIPHIYIPTTLLGYVDAAIGIKTGINFQEHKNRIGTFAPPQKVILDKTFFKTLEHRQILNGVGEIIKIAIIKDAVIFGLLETHGHNSVACKFQDEVSNLILDHAISSMIEELEPNLFEDNLERCVDFGHTFSPLLELVEDLHLLHGEAVIIDCIISSIMAMHRKLLLPQSLERILNLIKNLSLRTKLNDIHPRLLWESLIERSHHRNGFQRLPLPSAIGKCIFVNDIQFEEVTKAYEDFRRWSQH